MEKPFLQLVAEHIRDQYKSNTGSLCVVLPNKRGALFLKKQLAQTFQETLWLPAMISAEDLVSELSGLQVPDEPELLCMLYESYASCLGEAAEPFEGFARWGQLILHDYNEIDRYLVDAAQVYENLRNIKEIENWSLGAETLSAQQERYIRFMASLADIYRDFSSKLLAQNLAWPGLAYRVAAINAPQEIYSERFEKMLFCGFNALNEAEIRIFSTLQKKGKAEFLWDADTYYLRNESQEAGLFLRKNEALFPSKTFKFLADHFSQDKTIEVVSVPKQIGQAQVVRQKLQALHRSGVGFDRVAVVLANEKLLWPVLQQLPPEVEALNITMEYPLRFSASYDLIENLLQIQHAFSRQDRRHKTLYHKDLSRLLRQPLFGAWIRQKEFGAMPMAVLRQITKRNLAFLDARLLAELLGESWTTVQPFLTPQPSDQLLTSLTGLVSDLLEAENDEGTHNHTEGEHLALLQKGFLRIRDVMARYRYFEEPGAFRHLVLQVLGGQSVPFLGEPLTGLQVMGVLETRTLDFEHLILVNVNEGILPSGKSTNSFIPNDLKRAVGLPLYLEKDAVYAYHFYRLLQRAKTVTITYDSETDVFGKGEKSRFVTQLQMELSKYNPAITLSEKIAVSPELLTETGGSLSVDKDADILKNIVQKATSDDKYGALSPSGLISFKQCSLKFYLRYGVLLKESQEVEENPEAGTFGSILHLSLENLYKELLGSPLQVALLRNRLEAVDAVTAESFSNIVGREDLSGKSILQLEVIRTYVRKLISLDISRVEDGAASPATEILFLEHELGSTLDLPGSKPGRIFIKGKIDRIDREGKKLRVIDYKSSVKSTDKLTFSGFGPLFHDPAYDKQLQLFIYSWLIWKNDMARPDELLPCIIPFREFSEEPKTILSGRKEIMLFTNELLAQFEQELASFVSGIFNSDLPFTQTADRRICEYCAYNVVCNFHP